MSTKVVLASASPRRKQLLEQMGIEFDIFPSDKEEIIRSSIPSEVCKELSKQKAIDVASSIKSYNDSHADIITPQDIIVIGADTIVTYDGNILGKPADEADAHRMLRMLSGNTHLVYTGVTIVVMSKDGRVGELSFYESTEVTFYPLSDEEIDDYIATGEPMDKAGAYGIQGCFAKYVKCINGDFNNVVGLPVSRLYHEIAEYL